MYEKTITASEVRWKLIVVLKESWYMFPAIRTPITLLDQNREYRTILDVPNETLRRIRLNELNIWIKDNKDVFVKGSKVKISQKGDNQYSIEVFAPTETEIEEIPAVEAQVDPHIDLLVKLFKIGKCDDNKYVYIGRQERSRVERILEENTDQLGPYLIEQAENTGNDRIIQLDCIFLKEDDNLVIPKVVFEVELSNNFDAVINRIDALLNCLSSKWFEEILHKLKVVIVVPDDRTNSLENRVRTQGQWQRIVNLVRIQIWGVSKIEELYRSFITEGNFQRTQTLI